MSAELELLAELLPFLVPLFVIQLVLMVIALVDLAKRQRVTGDSKVVWILVIVLVNIIGPILYLTAGRKESIYDSNQN